MTIIPMETMVQPSSHGATDGDSDKNKEFRKSEDDHAKSSNDNENEKENYPGGDSAGHK